MKSLTLRRPPASFSRSALLATFCSLACAAILLPRLEAADAGAPQDAASRLAIMRERLGLSEEQLSELRPVLEDDAARMRALKDDTSLSDAEKRMKAGEMQTAFRDKVASLLTPEQKAKVASEMRNRSGNPGGGADGLQKLKAMKEKLGLSDEQVEKLKPILMEEGPKLQALREDKASAPEEKRQAQKQSLDRILAELTPEQREKMREQVKEKQERQNQK
jgi:Spy/CpxP family protein refolding chaperone